MIRHIHTTASRYGRVKESLNYMTRLNIVKPPLTKLQIKLKEQKIRDYELKRSRKPLTKATATKVIEKKLDIKLEKLTPETKFTEEQLKVLFKNPNKRLIYSFLGTSASQLKDAEIVKTDVKKFLDRDELSKAIYLCKLAQKKGVVAMNKVLEYLLNEKQNAEDAISLLNFRKKWGVPPNEFTYSILFEGLSKQLKPLNKKQSAVVIKILQDLKLKDQLSAIHLNTALKALFNSTDPTAAIEIFEKVDRKWADIDNKLFTVYLNGLSKISTESDNWIVSQADLCLTKAVNTLRFKEIDPQLIVLYSLCYSQRANLKYVSRAASILRLWFEICDESKITQIIRFNEPRDYHRKGIKISPIIDNMIPVEELNPFKKRFPLNNYVLDVYMTALQKLGLNGKALAAFEKFHDKVIVDSRLFNSYLVSSLNAPRVIDDLTLENSFFEVLSKMKEYLIKPNRDTNMVISKFLEKKIQKHWKWNELFFSQFLTDINKTINEAWPDYMSVNQMTDLTKCFTRILELLPYDEQIRFLNGVLFDNIQKTQLLKLNQTQIHDRHTVLDRIRSLEISALTVLKHLVAQLQSTDDRDELKWSSINRVKNALQAHVHYLGNLEEMEDPGYEKLKKLEQEKKASVLAYKKLILKE